MKPYWWFIIGALLAWPLVPGSALAQYGQPPSYSDYYANKVANTGRPTASPREYTLDRYFMQKPTLSPYLNLTRSSSNSIAPAYQTYVVPEMNRRAAVAPNTAPGTTISGAGNYKTQMSPAAPSRPPPTAGHYYNHWYGSRASMGLK